MKYDTFSDFKKWESRFNSDGNSQEVLLLEFNDRPIQNPDRNILHSHDFLEIIFVHSGDTGLLAEGNILSVIPGSIILIPPGVLHRTIINSFQTEYQRSLIWVSTTYLEDILCRYPELYIEAMQPLNSIEIVPQGAVDRAELRYCMHRLYRMMRDMLPYSKVLSDCYFIEILAMLHEAISRNHTSPMQGNENAYIRTVVDYINTHFTDRRLTLDEISAVAHLNKSYLARMFKKYTGITLHAYITKKRLSYARQSIFNGDPVLEACYASGFNDYTAFHKAFRKEYGTSPGSSKAISPSAAFLSETSNEKTRMTEGTSVKMQ